MRIETRTVQIGENLGPIDWSFDFRSHFDRYGSSDAQRDAACARSVRWLRSIEAALAAGEPIRVTNDGGIPRCGIHPVIEIGMYDGWPYWRPTPSVRVATHLGSDWYSFSSITNVYPSARDSGREALL